MYTLTEYSVASMLIFKFASYFTNITMTVGFHYGIVKISNVLHNTHKVLIKSFYRYLCHLSQKPTMYVLYVSHETFLKFH